MTRLAILLVTILISGCTALEPDAPPSPGHAPVRLQEYARFTSHFHDGERTHEARLVAAGDPPRPASCSAVRDHRLHANDTCEVKGADASHDASRGAAWTLVATFRIRQDEAQPMNFTAVARDSSGATVAVWDGERHPHLAHVTE